MCPILVDLVIQGIHCLCRMEREILVIHQYWPVDVYKIYDNYYCHGSSNTILERFDQLTFTLSYGMTVSLPTLWSTFAKIHILMEVSVNIESIIHYCILILGL